MSWNPAIQTGHQPPAAQRQRIEARQQAQIDQQHRHLEAAEQPLVPRGRYRQDRRGKDQGDCPSSVLSAGDRGVNACQERQQPEEKSDHRLGRPCDTPPVKAMLDVSDLRSS
ncbi:MAG: hypothetical protein WDN44_10545 [Sphingomonas sp.]